MVEPLLYAALGFLTASLVALFMGRALWNRAVRLTTHRIMRRLPLSRDEIVASRDLLRAEVAVEHRRLERQANIMRSRMAQSMADVGRRDATILSMRETVEDARTKSAEAEARMAAGRKENDALQSEISGLRSKLARAEGSLTSHERMQKKHIDERAELIKLADDRRAEVAAAVGQASQAKLAADALKKELDAANAELGTLRTRLGKLEAELAETRAEKEDGDMFVSANAEEVQILRQQIERLAGDIARVAAGPRPGSGGVLQSAARASRETDPLGMPVPSAPTR